MKRIEIPIDGMKCQGCVSSVEKAVNSVRGVSEAKVILDKGVGRFHFDESEANTEAIVSAIEGAGFHTGLVPDDRSEVRDIDTDEESSLPEGDKRLRLEVRGMTCAACALAVEKALTGVPGVKNAVVNAAANAAGVRFDSARVQPESLIEAVKRAGYKATIGDDEDREGGAREWTGLAWTAALVIPILLIHYSLLEVSPKPLILFGLATILQFTAGLRFYRGAFYSLRAGTANMDVLVALGITAAWGYSSLVALFPSTFEGGRTFFEASAMLIFFIRLGKGLEASAKGRADDALRSLIRLKPDRARRKTAAGEETVPVTSIHEGDILAVRPGDKVPVDGTVVDGVSAVDESSITGESIPVRKDTGDSVTGGTIVVDGNLSIKATAVGNDTFLARMVRLVEEAQLDHAPIQRFADRVSNVFVPAVVSLAAITFAVWYFLAGGPFPFSLERAVAVLVVACPCALGLATPTAILVGTGVGLRRGILFKRGSALEAIGRVKSVLFDKTGTITKGAPELTDFFAISEGSETDALSIAASGATRSNHPLSAALVQAAVEWGVSTQDVTVSEEVPGQGIRFHIGSEQYLLGNELLTGKQKIEPAEAANRIEQWEREGRTVLHLASKSRGRIGFFALRDEPREGVTDAIARIEGMGVRTALVTGDKKATAEGIAAYVGLGAVHAEVLPDEKADLVTRVSKEAGPVAMVGDGVNDAPALARADVGIAIGAGTDVAKESGDVVLIQSDPGDVASALELGRATLSKIRQNLFWALIYNICAIPLAAGVFATWGVLLPPAVAGIAMAFSSITVVLNSLDLKRWRPVGV